MKSPLRKFRGFGHHKNEGKEKKEQAKLDELVQATQDMADMRDCYDSLLSAAAATANSAYEFSEALDELGTCLLEKTALNDDENSGRVLLMLGKIQFELQKLVNNYRTHIVQTITTPSESLLKELQTVEEMKNQCDDKRDAYKLMLAKQREKGRPRNVKGEFSPQKLQAARDEYEEEVTLFIFRLKSLKQGQSRSLLTQAARHHAAQLNFFKKGLKSLEVVEPHVKTVAEQQHIDYQFSALEDDDTEDDDFYPGYGDNDDGELSFDYGVNDPDQDDLSSSTNSMELDQVDHIVPEASTPKPSQENVDRNQADALTYNRRPGNGSKSAPIFADEKFDPPEKIHVVQPSSTRKFHTYVLPTPADSKNSASRGSGNPVSATRAESKSGRPRQLWHSSPLEPYKFVKDSRDDELSSTARFQKTQSVLKESNINSSPIRIPPPSADGLSFPQFNPGAGSDAKKFKRQAFSGPLTSKPWSNKPIFTASGYLSSVDYPSTAPAMSAHVRTFQPSVSAKVSPNASPPPMTSPKISELHELPRPPVSSARPTRPTSLIGHSAPLFSRGHDQHATRKMSPIRSSAAASPLPTPPTTVHRSFSIPSRGQRMVILPGAKLLEAPQIQDTSEEVASPRLTPIALTDIHPAPSVA